MTFALISFACTFGAAVVATFIGALLPAAALTKQSEDVVRLGIGLVAAMTALLLGLVTAGARSTFDSQDTAVRNSAAAILTLDRLLARYGPETKPTRDLIRKTLEFRLQALWGEMASGGALLDAPESTPPIEDIENQILSLSPQTDSQRWFKDESLKLSQEVVRTRWRVLNSRDGSIPTPFLVVVIFWLTVTFFSFGLYAQRNAIVIAVLFVSALSVAAAVFLILELDGPFDGVIRISSAPVRYALDHLGQ